MREYANNIFDKGLISKIFKVIISKIFNTYTTEYQEDKQSN